MRNLQRANGKTVNLYYINKIRYVIYQRIIHGK